MAAILFQKLNFHVQITTVDHSKSKQFKNPTIYQWNSFDHTKAEGVQNLSPHCSCPEFQYALKIKTKTKMQRIKFNS